jgi:hypothetical protein
MLCRPVSGHWEMPMPISVPLVTRARNPLAALERLPGWWLGKATTHRMLARDARDRRLDAVAEKHLRVAGEYERRATQLALR